MRRAIQQGRALGLEPGFLPQFGERVRRADGRRLPGAAASSATRSTSGSPAEEEGFGRTLEQGTKLLEDLIARAKERGDEGIAAEDAFRLHDTYGFPIDLTRELVAEHGLGVDEAGLRGAHGRPAPPRPGDREGRTGRGRLRAGARVRDRGGRAHAVRRLRDRRDADDRRSRRAATTAGCSSSSPSRPSTRRAAARSPTSGEIACERGDCRARVTDVFRVGDDQAVVVDARGGRARARASA